MINFGSDIEFIQNYEKLKSSRKMGELYHCDKKSITTHAKKLGYDYSKHKVKKITIVPLDEVIAAYEELQSTNKVGELYDCSGNAVRTYLKNNGYTFPSQGKLINIPDDEFIANYEKLQSADKMGKYYNCSGTAILKHAKKIGYNIETSHSYKLSPEDKKNILDAYYTTTSTELAKKYNVSRGMITKVWYDNGLIGKQEAPPVTTMIDLTGQKFGLWTVLYPTERRNGNGGIYWMCQCECGTQREVGSSELRQGRSRSCGCKPQTSRGTIRITELLTNAGIPFEREKRFDSCRDQTAMPFDFFVNNQYLIEYDGRQHYGYHSIYDYEYIHKHDIMKTQWCHENNIPLIRIPYTQLDKLCLNDLILETTTFLD